jgi:hypothetical protein
MDGRRKSGSRVNLLERGLRAVEGHFPLVKKDRTVVFIGSDAILVTKKGEKVLKLRFWKHAQVEFRELLAKTLDKGRVPWILGEEYDIENKGQKMDPTPALALMGGTGEETIGHLERTPHVRACLLCKELLDQAASGDEQYQREVYATVLGHVKQNPKPEVQGCSYAGCVFHEDLTRELSRALIKLGKGGDPWKDSRGVPVSTIPLIADKEDHPKGWQFKRQDAESRTFKHLPNEEAGTVYIRLAPKRVTVHVWIAPQYKTKHEDVESPATIADVLETHMARVPDLKAWALKKYDDMKGLASMDLDLEGGTKK